MSKSKIGLQFDGWAEVYAKLDKIGEEYAKQAVESALEKSAEEIDSRISSKLTTSSLPAKGKYSTGETQSAISLDHKVEWEGNVASIGVGADYNKSKAGFVKLIFLMYGTPHMKPVAGLKSAIYGNDTRQRIAELQEAEFKKYLN